MNEKHNKIDRRNFLKGIGAAGLVPACAGITDAFAAEPNKPCAPKKAEESQFPQVPKRKLGKIDVEVSSLALGTMFDVAANQIVLNKAIQWGVTYWDTAASYSGGKSEQGIGKFLAKNPQVREQLFIVTKASGAKTIDGVEKCLQTSLKRMNTSYIDLFYGVHILSDPAQMTNELQQWAESAKKRKLIRFFGFSTHSNMAECLFAAAKQPWIDGVLTRYSFRDLQDAKMQDAVEACHKAGIGLTAMKTQGKQIKTAGDKKLTDHFLQQGLTEGQAKIKAVLEDKRFGSVAVRMQSVALLTTDVMAVLDKAKLSQADKKVLAEYAQETCSGYCAGCAAICDKALPDVPYISEIMRYLMYCNSYGERDMARELFAKIPPRVRSKLLATDYRAAEAQCPQGLPIAKLVAEAVSKLA